MSTDAVSMSQWPSDQRYVIPVAPGPDLVTVTIDGKEVQVDRGELLIKVAQDHGTYIPRFCWHERMKPVGMCRMCLVEVEGMRGLQISCATPVTDGMVVNTQSPAVTAAQDGVLELLLVNHPLDCPVCDRGGECPLQDQTLAFGPGESRFVEEKRHFEKPIAVSDTVLLDRERCIQCARCTRFASEVAGDALIHFGGRGSSTEVMTFPDEPFSSYFAGNTVQICPVGALTAKPYRFKARPWDLDSVETSCQQCAVGCRGALESASNEVVRLLGVDLDPVNQGWLCDRGRYAYEWIGSDDRVVNPAVRRGGDLVGVSWPEALDAAADALRVDPDAVGVVGGARGTNEDAYVWARLAKGVVGTDHVDAQLADGLPAEVVLGLPRATIDDLDRAAAIVVLGVDVKETLPVVYLRVRNAVEDRRIPLVDVAACDHGLTPYATSVHRHLPGDVGAAVAAVVAELPGLVGDRTGPVVVLAGRPSVAEPATATVHALAQLSGLSNARFLSTLHRGNVHGALDLGLAPGLLPGRVSLDAGRAHVGAAWGSVPARPGLDTAGILTAAAEGRIRTLVLLGADPLTDFPDRALVTAALARAEHVIVVGAYAADAGDAASVVLPTTVWGEQAGTTTNLEGRVLRLARKVAPAGAAMEAWRIAGELAARLGTDFDLETLPEVQDEMARVAPAFVGVDAALIASARDGVVLPLVDHADDLVLGPAPLGAGVSWEPIPAGSDAAPAPGADGGSTDADADADVASTEPVATAPAPPPAPPVPLLVWDRTAAPAPTVPVDGYALRLVAARTLYGDDSATRRSPALAASTPEGSVLRVHRTDRERIGVADGDRVRVTSARGSVEVPVVADPTVPLGVACLASNRRGPGAADLIGLGEAVTDLRVETLR